MPVSGSIDVDIRFDSILQQFIPNHVTAEVHTIAPVDGQPGKFGIRLYEFPLRADDPASITIPDPPVIIHTNDSAADPFTLTPTAPSASEFRPDYYYDDGPVKNRTSLVYFHSSMNGVEVSVEYYGGGSVNSAAVIQKNTTDRFVDTALTGTGTAETLGIATALLDNFIGLAFINPFTSVPTGFIELEGQAISRTTYAKLFAKYGTMYGAGNGTTTFNLPDYRGYFLRGWAHGQSTDPDKSSRTDRGDGTTGDNIGTKQGDQLKAHAHDQTIKANATASAGLGENTVLFNTPPLDQTSTVGGNETRPRNINVQFITHTGVI